MKYANIGINICPNCENEELNLGELYCKICGTYLINVCAGRSGYYDSDGVLHYITAPCNIQLPSNARFCSKCGATSTYSDWHLLRDWAIEQSNERNAADFFLENPTPNPNE